MTWPSFMLALTWKFSEKPNRPQSREWFFRLSFEPRTLTYGAGMLLTQPQHLMTMCII